MITQLPPGLAAFFTVDKPCPLTIDLDALLPE
jgi:hypothetical protein